MRPLAAVLRRAALAAGLAALLGAALAVPAPAAAGVRVVKAESLEQAVVARMNDVRKARGLRPLAVRPPLKKAGRDHARDMAVHGYFSHSWSDGRPFGTWIKAYWPGPGQYRSWSVGENLYWRSPAPSAKQVVAAWMQSAPHRRNLLRKDWRAVGVGAVETLDPFGAYAGVPRATIVVAEYGRRTR